MSMSPIPDDGRTSPVRRLRRHGTLAVLVPLAALGLASCSATPAHVAGGTTAPKGPTASAVVIIKSFAFSPATLRVRPGATVTVMNSDGVTHTLTSTTGAFDTGDISGGSSAHFTAPMSTGSYPYRCGIHQFMTGMLVVSTS